MTTLTEQMAEEDARQLASWRERQRRIGLPPLPRYESMGLPPAWNYINFNVKNKRGTK